MFLIGDDAFDETNCPIPPTDRGLTLGDGVFDTLLVENGQMIHGTDHHTRILRHATAMHITGLPTIDTLQSRARKLIADNNATQDRYALRTTITRGDGIRGLMPAPDAQPRTIMRIASIPDDIPPAKAWITTTTRRNEFSPTSRLKTTSYADNILALLESQNNGHNEAILLNTTGNVTCASAGNIYILENKELVTPPLCDGVMDGVTRCHLIKKHGITEQTISEDRLKSADSIYISNAICIRPVIMLNGKTIKSEHHIGLI